MDYKRERDNHGESRIALKTFFRCTKENCIMQNLVVFIQPSKDNFNISTKAATLYLNRFCIEEDSACELSGIYYLKSSEEPLNFALSQKAKGKTILNRCLKLTVYQQTLVRLWYS